MPPSLVFPEPISDKCCPRFGLTEASPVTHILQLTDARAHPGSIGRLIPNVEARIVDPSTGQDVPHPGDEGELWVRGPNVMKGYLGDVLATKKAFHPPSPRFHAKAWLKTGDVVKADEEGYFTVVDRRKELIKYNGCARSLSCWLCVSLRS